MEWLMCENNHWGNLPVGFDERKHFGKCACGGKMYLMHSGDPKDGGYREQDKRETFIEEQ